MRSPMVSLAPMRFDPAADEMVAIHPKLAAALDRRFAAPVVPDGPPKVDIMTVLWDLCEHHNQLRKATGAPLLSISPALFRVADRFVGELADLDVLTHSRQNGIPFYREIYAAVGYQGYCGENAAMGQFTVAQVMASWKSSIEHFKNMIEPRFVHFGASLHFAADGTPLWVSDFSA